MWVFEFKIDISDVGMLMADDEMFVAGKEMLMAG